MNWKAYKKEAMREGREGKWHSPEELYEMLSGEKYQRHAYRTINQGEEMATVERVILNYWKPLYLMDHASKQAFRFMDTSLTLLSVSLDDIDWKSLKKLPEDIVYRAQTLDAYFPTLIRGYSKGLGLVCWQINPDGQFYMDEDGYGMTDDEEIELIGKIDRQGKVVEKFRYVPQRHNW